jgi:hypothetical protein
MTPFSFPLSWPVIALLMLAWGGTGYYAGDHNRNNAWLAKQVVVERQAREALEAEVERGKTAAVEFIIERQVMQDSFQTLEGQFNELLKRGPLVVFRPGYPADLAVQPGGATGTSAAQAAAQSEGAPPAQALAPADVAAAGVGLTLGAVWMWNSALTAMDTPADSCGAADPTAPACAADSGLGLEAAWANHASNAKTCALDRLQLQRLIDFVTAGTAP